MKYQLVLQLPASSIEDYDRMIAVEEELIEGLAGLADIDGHDAGQGEVNIFILTDHPQQTFERIRLLPGARDVVRELRVAYREINSDEFKVLFPPGLDHFEVA